MLPPNTKSLPEKITKGTSTAVVGGTIPANIGGKPNVPVQADRRRAVVDISDMGFTPSQFAMPG
jgi:hypothetical protein